MSSAARRVGLLALVAVLTAAVLILTAGYQIHDTNFYTLWEATALLTGDHPYRDFFEWGVPLQAVVSAGAQRLVGYRLIGEFAIQWLFIIAGVVISCHLGLRLSRSIAASLITSLLAIAIVAATPTFHYPKLFFYPLAVWISWWYMDRPSVRRAAVFGAATAIAFLFRHDHGVYIGGVAVLAFGLARLAVPASRQVRSSLTEVAAFAVTSAVLIAPWALLVQGSEGLPEYVRSRADLYTQWSASQSPYRVLLRMNPIRLLTPPPLPPPKPARVSFEWDSSLDAARRQALEKQYGLRLQHAGASGERWDYEIANAYDVSLLDLNAFINNTEGFEWDRLQRARSRLPLRDNAQLWLEQTALVIPLLLLVAAAIDAGRSWRRDETMSIETSQIALAAIFLAVIDARLFREASYVVVVTPLTAALSTWFLVGRTAAWGLVRRIVAIAMLLVTVITTYAYTRDTEIFQPRALAQTVGSSFGQLLASPPIDGYMPPDVTQRYDPALWKSPDADKGHVMLRYVHDCTRPGDRVLVTGSTPYHVGYYAERSVAGGHLFWHHRWRSDPMRERQSLALLQQQSVPFALSTENPVLDELKMYPDIRDYLAQNYVELEGSGGRLLIDRRRQPTGTFAALGFPCFR